MRPDVEPDMPRHHAIQYDKYVPVMILYAVSPEPPPHYVPLSLFELAPLMPPTSLPRFGYPSAYRYMQEPRV